VRNNNPVKKPEALNFDNEELEEENEDKDNIGSPLIRLRKIKNKINSDIHIVKKEQ
jgi:hypothetical protein